jgi:hypothetical protein
VAESNITLSAEVGTDAPLGPPELEDQTDVELLFQVPVPPTQYLSAIIDSLQEREGEAMGYSSFLQ